MHGEQAGVWSPGRPEWFAKCQLVTPVQPCWGHRLDGRPCRGAGQLQGKDGCSGRGLKTEGCESTSASGLGLVVRLGQGGSYSCCSFSKLNTLTLRNGILKEPKDHLSSVFRVTVPFTIFSGSKKKKYKWMSDRLLQQGKIFPQSFFFFFCLSCGTKHLVIQEI